MKEKKAKNCKSVGVFLRIRPPFSNELITNDITLHKSTNSVHIAGTLAQKSKKYMFDYLGDNDSTQADIFNKVGKPIANKCLNGYNGTIFAYGQTGTGKTYTIQGPEELVMNKKKNIKIIHWFNAKSI